MTFRASHVDYLGFFATQLLRDGSLDQAEFNTLKARALTSTL